MFAAEEVHVIMAMGGGYGSARLIDKIDYKMIQSNLKIFLGFSDNTSLHVTIGKVEKTDKNKWIQTHERFR